MRKYLLLLFVSVVGFAQPISQYRYVIVPAKFDAQKAPGQFGLNQLTKLFLEKNGYTVFYDSDILPPEVSGESCNKIYADVFSDNSMRKTKLRVEIKDCRNAVLFVSEYGESAEKDNNVSYNQALRAAFRSFDKPEYRFDGTGLKSVKADPATSKSSEPLTETKAVSGQSPIIASDSSKHQTEFILSAQKISGGYQLVDTAPKIMFRLFITSQPDVFLAEADNRHGIVAKQGGQWFFEYRAGDTVIKEPLTIRF